MKSTDLSNDKFYRILSDTLKKGEKEPDVTVNELVKDISVKLSELIQRS